MPKPNQYTLNLKKFFKTKAQVDILVKTETRTSTPTITIRLVDKTKSFSSELLTYLTGMCGKDCSHNTQVLKLSQVHLDTLMLHAPVNMKLVEAGEFENEKTEFKQKGGDFGKGDSSSLDQYLTPPQICKRMWSLAVQHGFTGGRALEPAMGSGNFFIDAPQGTHLIGFEPDKKAFDYVKKEFPEVEAYNKYFESVFFDKERQFNKVSKPWIEPVDLIIGNPPYGIHKTPYTGLVKPAFRSMEYSFLWHPAKLLKKGGLLIYITASNFLRGSNIDKPKVLEQLEFIEAYRMPNGIFKGTQVGTDILVFRKK